MFDIQCDDCGRVLIGPSRILAVTADDEGLRVAYVCPCGRHGSEVTGRRRHVRTGHPLLTTTA